MAIPGGTSMGGPGGPFPSTRWSVLLEARDPASPAHRAALDAFCRIYWKPVYAYVRVARPHGNEEAKDLTQDFLVEVIEGGLVTRFDRGMGNFRGYLKGALQKFLLKAHRDATTEKRGGGRIVAPIDAAAVEQVERTIGPAATTPEEAFDRQWANALLDEATADLHDALDRSGRGVVFQVFERHDLNPPPEGAPSYAALASALGLKETDVTNHLSTCRRMLREILAARVREFSGGDDEARAELQRLLSL